MTILLMFALSIVGWRFVKKSDVMEILRTQQKTEMVKEVKGWIFPAGIILAVAGIVLWGGCTFVYSTHIRCQHASSMEWYLCIGTDWNLYDLIVGSGTESFKAQ